MSYSKQTWDTNSYVNPTRMNYIEDGIAGAWNAGFNFSDLLTSSNNLNNVTTPGNYSFAGGSVPTNKPPKAPSANGYLKVEYNTDGTNTIIQQTYETYYEGIVYTYKRIKWNSTTWGTWHEVMYDTNIDERVTRPNRKSVSVLTYAASLSEGIHFYTTNGNTADNPASGSHMFMIFRASTGITIFAMSLGARGAYINSSTDDGDIWSGWRQFSIQ